MSLKLGKILMCVMWLLFMGDESAAQEILPYYFNDRDYPLLALKKAKAQYDEAKARYQRAKQMYEKNLISKQEFDQAKEQYLIKEIRYQQAMLRVIFEQPHIIIESAVKYQTKDHKKRVRITVRNTTGGRLDYEKLLHSDENIFPQELKPDKINNVFVSIMNPDDETIIGQPYEIKIPELKFGQSKTVDFLLLREDLESVKVSMTYADKIERKTVFLQKDASANIVDINSIQFSQEVDLGGKATYDLTLERFSSEEDIYKLEVINLPQQISYEFTDRESGARLSQVKFTQGITSKTLALTVYLPEREDEQIVIDQPLSFYALVISRDQARKIGPTRGRKFTEKEIDAIQAGKVRLELIPRGVGRIEVRAPSLYHEIKVGDTLTMEITVKNTGTRRLDNIEISTDNPLGWRSVIEPDLIRSLEVEKEKIVRLTFLPPKDVGVGDQEIKIKTEALADNRRVETEDKTVRIHVEARTQILGSAILILFLVGLVVGVVIFGIRISRR